MRLIAEFVCICVFHAVVMSRVAAFFGRFMMFALLAHSSFGTSSVEYATMMRSCMTQFQMITAGIDGWGDESALYVAYVILVYTVQGAYSTLALSPRGGDHTAMHSHTFLRQCQG